MSQEKIEKLEAEIAEIDEKMKQKKAAVREKIRKEKSRIATKKRKERNSRLIAAGIAIEQALKKGILKPNSLRKIANAVDLKDREKNLFMELIEESTLQTELDTDHLLDNIQ